MKKTTNAKNLRKRKNRFFFIIEQIYWLLLRALTWLEQLRLYLQISNELDNDVLRCR